MASSNRIVLEVVNEDAIAFSSDVLVLKHAQDLYGLDEQVVSLFEQSGHSIRSELPVEGESVMIDSPTEISSPKVTFIGTPSLRFFGYKEIREFGRAAIQSLSKSEYHIEHISLTIHGAGFGLDEEEAFSSQLAGILDAITSGQFPTGLQKITILEKARRRVTALQNLLNKLLPAGYIDTDPHAYFGGNEKSSKQTLREAGYTSESKPHIFVAMPFKESMEDTWDYGIQPPIKAAGYICERTDLSSFTGDVMRWVRKRIKTAEIVVADLTESNPNVYLEVRYAWGVGVPTILLIDNESELKFDVRGQRCLKYKRIKDLEKLLEKELEKLNV